MVEDIRHLSRDSQSLWCFVMTSVPQQGAHHDSVCMTTVVSHSQVEFLYEIGHELPRLNLGKITCFLLSFLQIQSETQRPDPGRWQTQSTVGVSVHVTFYSDILWPSSHITTDAEEAQQTSIYKFDPHSSGEGQSKLEKPPLTSVPSYAVSGRAAEGLSQPIETQDASPPSSSETGARKQTFDYREIRVICNRFSERNLFT